MPSITLAGLRARVYDRLEENTAFWPSAEVDRAINSAIKTLNLATGFIQGSGTVTTVANQVWYSTPSTVLLPLAVDIDGRKLRRCGIRAMGASNPQFLRETTANTGEPVEEWIPIGITKFGIHPADSAGGRTLTVTGVAEPTPLSSDSHAITFPPEFGDAIEEYAAHLCQLKAAGRVASDGMFAYQNFMKRVSDLKRWKGKISPKFYIDVKAAV